MAALTPTQIAELATSCPDIAFVLELESKRAASLRKAALTGDMDSGPGALHSRLAGIYEGRISDLYAAEAMLRTPCGWCHLNNAIIPIPAHARVPGATRSPVLGSSDDTGGQT